MGGGQWARGIRIVVFSTDAIHARSVRNNPERDQAHETTLPSENRGSTYHSLMPETDLLQILLSHDRWATAQMLDTCGKLTDDQFHRRFEMGAGSLHDTLTHVVAAMRAWTETLAGVEARPRLDSDG